MKTAVLAFTGNGGETAAKIINALEKNGHEFAGYIYASCARDGFITFDNLSQTAERLFNTFDALVFVSACGIAVRAAAPYVKSKTIDPAVIVADEAGQYIIPILSGHIGGANALSKDIAVSIGGTAVITTATDINNKFAVDLFAVRNNLYITDMNKAKKISAEILRGHKIGFYSDMEYGNLPEELLGDTKTPLGICVSYNVNDAPFKETLNLIPKNVVLGIGCRRDIDADVFNSSVTDVLIKRGIPINAVKSIATIDLKCNEAAIKAFCDRHNLKAEFFSAEELAAVEGEFSASEFVKSVAGVDNVCERGAVRASGGTLLFGKQIAEGVTVAAAAEKIRLNFGKEKI